MNRTDTDSIQLTIPAKPKYLRIIRMTIRYICKTLNLNSGETNLIILAVDEACSNIIKHAYKGPTHQPIHISCVMFEDRIEFILEDQGERANLDEIKSRQLDDIRPGGLGVHLIKTVMDVVTYETNVERGNSLKMIKFLKPRDINDKN
ncbi:ATP-binding protein [candidate division KSB1 bacterium]|nr:ATP-binding protein [candidate division KSB1 bacterium]